MPNQSWPLLGKLMTKGGEKGPGPDRAGSLCALGRIIWQPLVNQQIIVEVLLCVGTALGAGGTGLQTH